MSTHAKIAFESAQVYTNQLIKKRKEMLTKLQFQIKENPSESCRQKYRHHLYAILKSEPEIERSLRDGQTPLKIPKFSEMSLEEWQTYLGPLQVRYLAKTYGILGPILPSASESTHYVDLKIGNDFARRGNIIFPTLEMNHFNVKVNDLDPSKTYHAFIVDADAPIESEKRRAPYCLWASHPISGQSQLDMSETSPSLIKYQPPHPGRGSDTHRIICVVAALKETRKLPADRDDFNLLNILEGGHVIGYQFFRTFWTKTVSALYKQLNKPEPLYGEVLETPQAPPPKFENF